MVDDDFSFPGDLLAAQRRLSAAEAEHVALCRALPSRARAAQRRPRGGPPPGEWVHEQADHERRVRARVLELAEAVHGHPYWQSLPPDERAAARSALRRHGPDAPAAAAATLAA
ncbi:hypothetical protein [Streptomyces sp. YIM 98790]|uniref:hypothetical protein n=1 Tax=Streptomyces sp. YIM 98790 TaxID=2689077 RepID=UPI00140C7A20|nr:hypothetical protein [Streptomyces sp. YIM 98790]